MLAGYKQGSTQQHGLTRLPFLLLTPSTQQGSVQVPKYFHNLNNKY